MRAHRFAFASAFAFALTTAATIGPAAAQPQKADPAAAQALFYEARALMKDGKFAQACPKLEESLRLDYGIGTEFNLADCHEKLGKVATAWSGFTSVASTAKVQGQADREKVARQRAKALETRLPKIAVTVAMPAPGLEVKRDGVVVGPASFATAVPVDPGAHVISATAPGKQAWETRVNAQEGKLSSVSVPPLAPILVATGSGVTTTQAQVEPQPTPILASYPDASDDRTSPQRTAGWVVGAVGLASLAVAGGFGVRSLVQHNKSDDHCSGDACDAAGVSYRDSAISSGNIATITGIAGGVAAVGGLVLLLTAPKGPRHEPSSSASWRAVPQVGLNGGGLSIQGILP